MENAVKGFWHYVRTHADSSVYRCYLGRLRSNVGLWQKHFPGIQPYYAIKCNPEPNIATTLASLGCGFDCASKNELTQVMNLKGITPLQSPWGSERKLDRPPIIY